jgi:hypothetical protein
MNQPNLNIEKLQKQSKESSAKNSQSSERLCSQQINNLIERYKEPEQARQFLVGAGIIDKNGDLMPPYQNTSTQITINPSMPELSPATQAVLEASAEHWAGTRTQAIAAALRAAADLLSAEVDAPKVDGSKYNGLWHSHDLLNAIADELESQ